jgi:flagellar hook-length control protein FliK
MPQEPPVEAQVSSDVAQDPPPGSAEAPADADGAGPLDAAASSRGGSAPGSAAEYAQALPVAPRALQGASVRPELRAGQAAASPDGRGAAPSPDQPGARSSAAAAAPPGAAIAKPAAADAAAGARIAAEPIVARDPAVGRAMQVQAALAVEVLTGAAADASAGARQAIADRASLAGGAPAQAPVPAGHAAPETAGALLRGLSAMVNHSGGVMTMRLDPPDLGQVRVHMTIAQGTVTAHFQPATAEAQAILERSLPALRAALEGHGLAAERLTVQSAPPAPAAREQAQDQPAHERHHHDAGGGESRGRRDGAEERRNRAAWDDAPFEVPSGRPHTLQGDQR